MDWVQIWVRVTIVSLIWLILVATIDVLYEIDTSEEGLLEGSQAGLLVISAAIWGGVARLAQSMRRRSELSVALVFVAVCSAGAFRELSFGRNLGMAPGMVAIAKPIEAIFVLTFFVAALICFLRERGEYVARFRGIVANRSVAYLAIALAVGLLGELFEKHMVDTDRFQLLEEALEFAAYATLAFGGIEALRSLRSTA